MEKIMGGGLDIESLSKEEIVQRLRRYTEIAPVLAEKAAKNRKLRAAVIEAFGAFIEENKSKKDPAIKAIEKMKEELEITEFLSILNKGA